jgi:Flp pilus assembly protein CpaB
LIVAGLAGLAAAVLFIVAVNQDDSRSTGTAGGSLTAVVAKSDIAYGDEISQSMVELSDDIPDGHLVKGALEDTSAVVGQRARIAISAGEQITAAKIGEGIQTGEGIAWLTPPGMRAFAFEADEIKAVGGQLLPTDRVDVIARFRLNGEPGLADNQYVLKTEFLFQNIEVLAVGQEKAAPAPVSNGDSGSRGQLTDNVQEQPGARTVTLGLTPEQVKKLTHALGSAEYIGLAARPAGDTGELDIPPTLEVMTE